MEDIIDYIADTNLFNFIIFLGIIVFICKKINVSLLLEKAVNSVKERIENSKTAKSESEFYLKDIEDTISDMEAEEEQIAEQAEIKAKSVGEKFLEDAASAVKVIKNNAQKAVENKTISLKNDILEHISQASVKEARNRIIARLKDNAELHDKLIDESIDAINQ